MHSNQPDNLDDDLARLLDLAASHEFEPISNPVAERAADDEERRQAKLRRNRESADRSRKRKREEVAALRSTVKLLEFENNMLRAHVGRLCLVAGAPTPWPAKIMLPRVPLCQRRARAGRPPKTSRQA
jgi:hypothetical protein